MISDNLRVIYDNACLKAISDDGCLRAISDDICLIGFDLKV